MARASLQQGLLYLKYQTGTKEHLFMESGFDTISHNPQPSQLSTVTPSQLHNPTTLPYTNNHNELFFSARIST